MATAPMRRSGFPPLPATLYAGCTRPCDRVGSCWRGPSRDPIHRREPARAAPRSLPARVLHRRRYVLGLVRSTHSHQLARLASHQDLVEQGVGAVVAFAIVRKVMVVVDAASLGKLLLVRARVARRPLRNHGCFVVVRVPCGRGVPAPTRQRPSTPPSICSTDTAALSGYHRHVPPRLPTVPRQRSCPARDRCGRRVGANRVDWQSGRRRRCP